jgi:hypothetical protein
MFPSIPLLPLFKVCPGFCFWKYGPLLVGIVIGGLRNSTVSQIKWYLRMGKAYYFRIIAISLLYVVV